MSALLTGVRILVVEDDEDSRLLFEVALSACGAEVESAANAVDGLEAFRAREPDALVSDLSMPERDGYWLIGQVRALRRARVVPAVAVTGLSQRYDAGRAIAEGFHEYLTKPVDPQRLCEVVARLVGLVRPA